MAGMMGIRRAMPRLSPSAMSAICCAAKAASVELRVEKIAPAIAAAVPGLEMWGGLEIDKPLGRLWRERRESGFTPDCFKGLFGGELMPKHLALRMAMEAIVAIGDCCLLGWRT